jgi:hypothetical protein
MEIGNQEFWNYKGNGNLRISRKKALKCSQGKGLGSLYESSPSSKKFCLQMKRGVL